MYHWNVVRRPNNKLIVGLEESCGSFPIALDVSKSILEREYRRVGLPPPKRQLGYVINKDFGYVDTK